jgi:hypothetical protein
MIKMQMWDKNLLRVISGFRREGDEKCALLGY